MGQPHVFDVAAEPLPGPAVGRAALARGLDAFAGDVFAYRGDGFSGEALDYVRIVAG
jgi:hypothetical protein